MKPHLALITLLTASSLALAQSAPSTTTAPTTVPSTVPATQPRFTLGKDTTRITAPLLADGRPDYVAYLDQLHSKGVTPDNNALVALFEVFGTNEAANTISPRVHDEALKRLGIKEDHAPAFQSFLQYLKKQGIPCDNAKDQEESLARKHPWGADEFPDSGHWLDENDQALDRIAQAAAREHYYWPRIATTDRAAMITVMLPSLGCTREAANALTARAMRRLDNGQIKECQADLIATHRLGRLVSQGPTLIENLVGVAIETLAARADVELADGLKPDAAKAYLTELAKLPPMGSVSDTVDSAERFALLDAELSVRQYGRTVLRELYGLTEGGESSTTTAPPPLQGLDPAAVDWDKVLQSTNAVYDRLVAGLRKTKLSESRAALLELEKYILELKAAALTATDPTDRMTDLLLGILFPSVIHVRELAERGQERTDLGTLAIALAAFHGDHNAYPDTLADLAPNYLKSIPQDLFSAAPLKYHKQGLGYVLYSIGPDLKDDDGVAGENDALGDIVVKMFK